MNDKNNDSKQRFMCEKIPSMKRRSLHNNYYGRQIYMLTLIVEGRRPILGKLIGNINDENNPPRIELSVLGKCVQECWDNIPKHHPETPPRSKMLRVSDHARPSARHTFC